MKLASDIKSIIEDDIKKMAQVMLTGEISIDGISLADEFSEDLIHQFAASIIHYQLENKLLSSIIPYLSTMKWLTLAEACIYARKSRNTMLELIKNGKIYGAKPENSGEYIVDRESIDTYYNVEKDERRLRLVTPGRRLL